MKVLKIKHINSPEPTRVLDLFVDKGYLQGASGSLPDVDVDYQADRRQEVKEYIERRYNHNGKQRVFSAGTFTTLKLKAVLKDVARVYRVPVSIVNYITAIFENDKMSWSDLFVLAATNAKVKKFINDYPQVIEDIRTLMGQPRSSSVHASALLVTPDSKDGKDMECFDFTPIKKVDGMLVSEFDGYSLDGQGLLKNDCLGIKELSKIQAVIEMCNKEYNANLNFQGIVKSKLDDPKVYDLLQKGFTQNVFQFSSKGMTKFLMSMKPDKIDDLIAANALFRPATLDSGSAERYVDCKLGDAAPVYLWGTYNILKETYGQMVYQEDLAKIAQNIGGFALGEGVKLVKFISKKKLEKIKELKGKFMEGAKAKGCPDEDALAIWDMIESGGSYLFNKCISGKEYIARTNYKNTLSIEEMYNTMHDVKWTKEHKHSSLRDKYRQQGYGKSWSLIHTEGWDDYLLKNDIVDIRYMGVRSLYRITLENGATLDVTLNHKHPTNNGVKRTDELEIGVDKMYICKEIASTELKTVVSIEYIGEDNVYDVEMAAPNHTFTTNNGVVTCNSHATAYAVTAYAGAYLKANYPTAFYTVALQWANDDEIPALMSEMEQCSQAKIVAPDINESRSVFYTNFQTNEIYWSLPRIKMLGLKAAEWIVNERESRGPFTSIENFIDRIFKYKFKHYQYWDDPDNPEEATRCPVNARHIRHLIFAGCFDKIENAQSVIERYAIMDKAAKKLGFEITEKDIPSYLRGKHYFWSQQQIAISGIGAVDYKRIYDNSPVKAKIKGRAKWVPLSQITEPALDGSKIAVCASIADIEERTYQDRKTGEDSVFGKLILQQNNDITELTIWNEDWCKYRANLTQGNGLGFAKGKILVCSAAVRYNDYAGKNTLQSYKSTIIKLLQ